MGGSSSDGWEKQFWAAQHSCADGRGGAELFPKKRIEQFGGEVFGTPKKEISFSAT
jgi:hypothetical protein